MALQFTQFEVEGQVGDVIKHGMETRIAEIVGVGQSLISQQINKDEEKISWVYRYLQFQCAVDELDEEVGNKLLQIVLTCRELSKKRKNTNSDIDQKASDLIDEFAGFLSARLQKKSFSIQINELNDILRKAEEVKQTMLDNYNDSKERFRTMPSIELNKSDF